MSHKIFPCPFCAEHPQFFKDSLGESHMIGHDEKCVLKSFQNSLGNVPLELIMERWNFRKRGKRIERLAVLPLELNTDAFKAVWSTWLKHLKEKNKFPTLTAQDMQLKKCQSWGHDHAIEVILNSAEKGWQGLYDTNTSQQSKRNLSPGRDFNTSTF